MTKRQHASTVIIIMCLVTCILCFIPMYAPYHGQNSTNDHGSDDYAYLTGYLNIPIFNQASISALVIVVIPALDILLDNVPSFLLSLITWYDVKLLPKEVSGMTKIEHCLFIIGMFCVASSLSAYVTTSSNALTLYFCFENCSTSLTTCPLISFVVRRTDTWSPAMCIIIALLVCCSSFLSSLSLCFDPTSVIVAQMNLSCNIILSISTCLFFINTLWSLIKSIQWEQVGNFLPLPHSCLSISLAIILILPTTRRHEER